ncbi:MAG: DJ-1/PfpI family protein [Anaerolineaceae bacterium]|nr:DJ-1/PfpI family protein [Anaerolineaceae bacterium]
MQKMPVLFVLVEKYADWEGAFLAADIMTNTEKNGLVVKTVGVQTSTPSSIGGFKTQTDYMLEDAPEDFAGLVLIGGETWRMPEVEKVSILVRMAVEKNVPIGFICDATVFAAKHGFLNKIRHTSNLLSDLREYCAEAYTNKASYIKEQAVSDGGIVTANGDAPAEFAYLMAKALKLASEEEIEDSFVAHKHGFYARCGRKPEWQSYLDEE